MNNLIDEATDNRHSMLYMHILIYININQVSSLLLLSGLSIPGNPHSSSKLFEPLSITRVADRRKNINASEQANNPPTAIPTSAGLS